MKSIPLQLVTVSLENGEQGIFIGVPLIAAKAGRNADHIEDIWFSDIQEVPPGTELAELVQLLQSQLCRCQSTLQ